MFKVYMWPVWFLQLFTETKSFAANPIIGSHLFNLSGLHVVRLVISHAVSNFRWFLLRPLMPIDLRKKFHQNGFVAIEGFLSEDDFVKLRQDLQNCSGEARELTQGDTFTQRILLDDDGLKDTPELAKLVRNKTYQNYLSYGAAKFHPSLIYLQRIRNGFAKGKQKWGDKDPQKNLHSDTFHPNMKAWYFLDDVPMGKGPFTFVPGSQQLAWKRLKWEYKKSLSAAQNPDGYSKKGSLRILPKDLQEMGLPAPRCLSVKANTLVIANPHGFHCRGQADPETTRFEIWAYSRHNPFNPLPGFGLKVIGKLEAYLLRKYWQHMDQRALKRGGQSSWHIVDSKAVTDENWQDPRQET